MKVGVNLLNFGPGATPESLSRWTEIAETLGYHLVMISDHIAVTPDVEGRYPAPFYDPFTTLSWLAGKTHRVVHLPGFEERPDRLHGPASVGKSADGIATGAVQEVHG